MATLPDPVKTAIGSWFDANFCERGELGASLSIWKDGSEVVSLAGGEADRERTRRWTVDTLVPVWSATKGPAAAACLMALHDAGLPLECPVVEVWPEFGGEGKARITFSDVLSHRAGLCALDERVPMANHAAVIAALERQRPLWPPGSRQAYHARTFGFLLDEMVRRITGAESLGEYFRQIFGDPMELDFWIGLPQSEWGRLSKVYPGRVSVAGRDQAFLRAFDTHGSVTRRAFNSPVGLGAVSEMNQPAAWAMGNASMGGIGSARGLGRFYSMLAARGRWQGRTLVPERVLGWMQDRLSQGEDEVLCVKAAFSAGFMKDPMDPESGSKLRRVFGPSAAAFGHPGAGGSLAFADPETGIAFAYVMNQMEPGVLPAGKAMGLVEALYAA